MHIVWAFWTCVYRRLFKINYFEQILKPNRILCCLFLLMCTFDELQTEWVPVCKALTGASLVKQSHSLPTSGGSQSVRGASQLQRRSNPLSPTEVRLTPTARKDEPRGASGSREVGVRDRDGRVHQETAVAWMKACKWERWRSCKRRWESKPTDGEGVFGLNPKIGLLLPILSPLHVTELTTALRCAERTSLPLDLEFSNMTGFGQWNGSREGPWKLWMSYLGSPALLCPCGGLCPEQASGSHCPFSLDPRMIPKPNQKPGVLPSWSQPWWAKLLPTCRPNSIKIFILVSHSDVGTGYTAKTDENTKLWQILQKEMTQT